MASNRGLVPPGEWAKHLKPIGKRIQAKAERKASEREIEMALINELNDDSPFAIIDDFGNIKRIANI